MPKRTDLKKILVIGSGPIVIGQAAEFDYAGTQACLALKEEGYEVILCNSNPATIMTDPAIADKVYMEPLTLEYLARICRLERPDNSPRMVYDSIGKISAYLARLYIGSTREQVYLMMFDNAMRLIDCAYICDGSVNAAVMVPRVMVEKALFRHASAVVVAHNHPDGVAVPSGDDIDTTEMLRAAFELVGIQLLEHIIIAGRSYATVMRQRNMATVHSDVGSLGGHLSAGILEHLYDDLPESEGVMSVPDEIVTDLPARRQDGLGKL